MINMEAAKKLLDENKPRKALERLKKILPTAQEEWRIHELIGACFHDLCDAEGAAQAYFNAATTDRFLRSQRAHFSNLTVYNSLYRDAVTISNEEL